MQEYEVRIVDSEEPNSTWSTYVEAEGPAEARDMAQEFYIAAAEAAGEPFGELWITAKELGKDKV